MDKIVTSILIEIVLSFIQLSKNSVIVCNLNEWMNEGIYETCAEKKKIITYQHCTILCDCDNLMQIWMNKTEFIDHVHDHEIWNNERKSLEVRMEHVM